jgi:tetratricopeptide (TPR) repeat protein
MPQCPQCGGELSGEEVVCPHCLARLSTAPAESKAGEAPRQPKTRFRPVEVRLPEETEPSPGRGVRPEGRRVPLFRDEDAVKTLAGTEAAPAERRPVRGLRRAAPPPKTIVLSGRLGRVWWLVLIAAFLAVLALGVSIGRLQAQPRQPIVATPDLMKVGQELYDAGRYEAAQYVFGQAVAAEMSKPQSNLAPALLMMGWSAYRTGKYEEAEAMFGAAAGMMPNSPEPYLGIGLTAMARQNWEDAELWLNEAYSRDPNSPQVLRALGQFYLQRGSSSAALNYLRRALEKAPDDPETRRWLGLALYAEGNYEEAVQYLAPLAGGDAANDEVLHALYESYMAMAQYDQALEAAGRLESLHPDDPEPRYLRGQAQLSAGQFEAALQTFQEVIQMEELRSLLDDSLRQMGVIYSHLERYEEALQPLDRALAINPADVEAMNLKGWALARLGKCAEALPVFEQALALMPAHQGAQEGRKACRQWLGLE